MDEIGSQADNAISELRVKGNSKILHETTKRDDKSKRLVSVVFSGISGLHETDCCVRCRHDVVKVKDRTDFTIVDFSDSIGVFLSRSRHVKSVQKGQR